MADDVERPLSRRQADEVRADLYAIHDELDFIFFHQAVAGGTGANHIMLRTGDAIWFSDGKGNLLKPPVVAPGTKNAGKVD
jgi:phospholipase C